jgi:hypothetical protein
MCLLPVAMHLHHMPRNVVVIHLIALVQDNIEQVKSRHDGRGEVQVLQRVLEQS